MTPDQQSLIKQLLQSVLQGAVWRLIWSLPIAIVATVAAFAFIILMIFAS